MDNLGLVVWNPYLGHTRWIEPKTSYAVSDQYDIGYDNKKNHKVLRRFSNEFEIYDFNSNSWRVLDITYDRSFVSSASLKGNTYYVERDGTHLVSCFDFTTERFGPCLQLPFQCVRVTLSCVGEEQLAVFNHRCSTVFEMEIWITTKIGPTAVSWSKFFKVDVPTGRSSYFLSQFKVTSFFIDKEKKVAVISGQNYHDDRFESVVVGENGYFKKRYLGDVFSYVPSSVQIQ